MKEQVGELKHRIDVACRLLEKYQGETITANEHPLHLAIQEVEKLSHRRSVGGGQKYQLPRGVKTIWYMLLDASRRGSVRYLLTTDFDFDSLLPKQKKRRSILLAGMLYHALIGCVDLLARSQDDPHLPVVSERIKRKLEKKNA